MVCPQLREGALYLLGGAVAAAVSPVASIAAAAAGAAGVSDFQADLGGTYMMKNTATFDGRMEMFEKEKSKLMDSSRLHSLGWQAQVDLTTGLALAYQDFLKQQATP